MEEEKEECVGRKLKIINTRDRHIYFHLLLCDNLFLSKLCDALKHPSILFVAKQIKFRPCLVL